MKIGESMLINSLNRQTQSLEQNSADFQRSVTGLGNSLENLAGGIGGTVETIQQRQNAQRMQIQYNQAETTMRRAFDDYNAQFSKQQYSDAKTMQSYREGLDDLFATTAENAGWDQEVTTKLTGNLLNPLRNSGEGWASKHIDGQQNEVLKSQGFQQSISTAAAGDFGGALSTITGMVTKGIMTKQEAAPLLGQIHAAFVAPKFEAMTKDWSDDQIKGYVATGAIPADPNLSEQEQNDQAQMLATFRMQDPELIAKTSEQIIGVRTDQRTEQEKQAKTVGRQAATAAYETMLSTGGVLSYQNLQSVLKITRKTDAVSNDGQSEEMIKLYNSGLESLKNKTKSASKAAQDTAYSEAQRGIWNMAQSGKYSQGQIMSYASGMSQKIDPANIKPLFDLVTKARPDVFLEGLLKSIDKSVPDPSTAGKIKQALINRNMSYDYNKMNAGTESQRIKELTALKDEMIKSGSDQIFTDFLKNPGKIGDPSMELIQAFNPTAGMYKSSIDPLYQSLSDPTKDKAKAVQNVFASKDVGDLVRKTSIGALAFGFQTRDPATIKVVTQLDGFYRKVIAATIPDIFGKIGEIPTPIFTGKGLLYNIQVRPGTKYAIKFPNPDGTVSYKIALQAIPSDSGNGWDLGIQDPNNSEEDFIPLSKLDKYGIKKSLNKPLNGEWPKEFVR